MTKRDAATIDMFDDWLAEQPEPVAAPAPVAELETQPSPGLHENLQGPPQRSNASGELGDMAPASRIGCAEAIDFLTRRTKLGRWILHPGRSIEAYERGILREIGELAPAPILAFAPRPPPPDPGDDDAPQRRAG
jgi:hypothetical protein